MRAENSDFWRITSMSDERQLKSAYEIAMERLKVHDQEQGIEEAVPLSEKQKLEIAELRREAKSKIAELRILHKQPIAETQEDLAKLAEIEEKHRIDVRRVESRLESAIARVKENGSG
jgi:hypothetical protein